jgi:hypothetical protein
MRLSDRAQAYVSRMPAAISGQGGHQATFAAAVALVHGFEMSEGEAWPILSEFNERCEPPWSESELRHKLESAGKLNRHPMPRGHLRGQDNTPNWRTVTPTPTPEPIPWHVEPRRPKAEPVAPAAPLESAGALPNNAEARRVASELVKLHNDGAITGPHDPEAGFYAAVIHSFGATYSGRNEP